MIIGTHFLIYSKDAVKDRAFLKNVLGFRSVDAGEGWLVFALPPSEVAVHPAEKPEWHELYLLTDDVHEEIARLTRLGVACSAVKEQSWGSHCVITLPSGGLLGLYQPKHPMAISPRKARRGRAAAKPPARARRRGER